MKSFDAVVAVASGPNAPLIAGTSPVPADGEVVCRERLGGVLRHYCREAA